MFIRKRKLRAIEYAFHTNIYFFEDMDTTLPWVRVRYSTS